MQRGREPSRGPLVAGRSVGTLPPGLGRHDRDGWECHRLDWGFSNWVGWQQVHWYAGRVRWLAGRALTAACTRSSLALLVGLVSIAAASLSSR